MVRARSFLFAGTLLFLIGIFTGIAVQLFHNPRLGVSGHLIAVLNGMFLMIVGLFWQRLALGDVAKKWARNLLFFGTYGNWFLTTLGAIWGTKKLTPIAGEGFGGTDVQELLVAIGLGVMIIGMTTGVGIVLYGLRGDDPTASP